MTRVEAGGEGVAGVDGGVGAGVVGAGVAGADVVGAVALAAGAAAVFTVELVLSESLESQPLNTKKGRANTIPAIAAHALTLFAIAT